MIKETTLLDCRQLTELIDDEVNVKVWFDGRLFSGTLSEVKND